MSSTVTDLPDPLQPLPALNSSNPDDLLSKMADEAIDKLIADADKGTAPPAPLPPMASVSPDGDPAPESIANTVVETAVPPAVSTPEVPDVALSSQAAEHVDSPPETATASAASAPVAEAPAADKKALLDDHVSARPPVLLLPLAWLNAPFAKLSDRTRNTFGLLGVVTLVPALCAIVYILFLKH